MRAIYELRYAHLREAYDAQWSATDLDANHRRLQGDESVGLIDGYLAGRGALAILDVGCGMGRTVEHFLRQGHQVTGIDLATAGLRLYRRRRPAARLVCGSLVDLPFRGPSFDLILLMGVLYEIEALQAMPPVLRAMQGLLRPAGRLIYVSQYPKDLWKTVLSYVPFRRRWFRRLCMPSRAGQTPHFSRWVVSNRETVRLFARAGWRVERVAPVNQYYGAANWFYDVFYRQKGQTPLSFEVEQNPVRHVRLPGRLIARLSRRWWPMLSAGLVYFQFAPDGEPQRGTWIGPRAEGGPT
ncbi:MAG: class I SAM-dependent methyltransferase [Candidatus Latescibacterota bacterium]